MNFLKTAIIFAKLEKKKEIPSKIIKILHFFLNEGQEKNGKNQTNR